MRFPPRRSGATRELARVTVPADVHAALRGLVQMHHATFRVGSGLPFA